MLITVNDVTSRDKGPQKSRLINTNRQTSGLPRQNITETCLLEVDLELLDGVPGEGQVVRSFIREPEGCVETLRVTEGRGGVPEVSLLVT